MKTKRLIELLQEADPDGELECCIGNVDILSVNVEPAWYDGCLQVLERDPDLAPFYDVVGARYISTGEKVSISEHPIRHALMDHPDMPVTFDEGSARYAATVEEWRTGVKEIKRDAEFDYFSTHVWKRLRQEAWFEANRDWLHDSREYDAIRAEIRAYFDQHIGQDTPIPKELRDGRSYVDARNEQWQRTISVQLLEGKLILGKRAGRLEA